MINVAIAVMSSVTSILDERKAFNRFCDSLSEDEADKLRAARSRIIEENLRHLMNLEVAREGRSLNFWGNR